MERSPPTEPSPEPEEEDIIARAEKVKEQGNVAFKAAKYTDAIEHYTKAIGTWPSKARPPVLDANQVIAFRNESGGTVILNESCSFIHVLEAV
jgi:hypothetical protein